jgi:MFS family permease
MSDRLYCVNHPDVETYLRCNRCGRPICPRCAVQTPVGYRCRDCINAQQKAFFADFRPIYYLVAALVALPLSLVAGALIPLTGWFTIFLGPVVGAGIAEITRWAIRRRRGRYTWLVVCGSIVVGGLLRILVAAGLILLAGLLGGTNGTAGFALSGVFAILWPIVYVVTATGAAYWRLRPGKRV